MKCVFQVLGQKDSGKTSVIERVVSKAKEKGLKVAVVKKSHHVVDPEGKDTWRFRKSGADMVLFYGSDDVTSVLISGSPTSILRLLPCDLVLVEGFKQEDLGEKFIVDSPAHVEEVSSLINSRLDQCFLDEEISVDGERRKARTDPDLWLLRNLMVEMRIGEVRLK
jgi:molybdopterin-guanine dinucleotide biosynthesis protein B